jgi:2-pyrone-4,6-dicarboxylate lactonase
MGNAFHDDMIEALANLRAPSQPLPPGSCDVHAHVFGPFDRFRLSAAPRYKPPLAPYEQYVEMLDRVGTSNGVLVHAGAYGFDNSATVDALERAKGRFKGVAVVPPDTTDSELERMNRLGFCGVRFTEMGAPPSPGVLGFEDLKRMAPRLKSIGWHAQVWAKCDVIAENSEMLRSLGIPVVFDHMGQFEVIRGLGDASFSTLVDLLEEGPFWLKVTASEILMHCRTWPMCAHSMRWLSKPLPIVWYGAAIGRSSAWAIGCPMLVIFSICSEAGLVTRLRLQKSWFPIPANSTVFDQPDLLRLSSGCLGQVAPSLIEWGPLKSFRSSRARRSLYPDNRTCRAGSSWCAGPATATLCSTGTAHTRIGWA